MQTNDENADEQQAEPMVSHVSAILAIPAPPTELERELTRWYGNLLQQLEPRVSSQVFATLDDGRLNLNRILNAARAANP